MRRRPRAERPAPFDLGPGTEPGDPGSTDDEETEGQSWIVQLIPPAVALVFVFFSIVARNC